MKVKSLFAMVVLALTLSGIAYGAFRLYERHLSNGLRRTLLAAADATASNADIHAYLRRARLQIRTERDAEVFGKLATAVQLSDSARQHERLNLQNLSGNANQLENSPCMQMGRLTMKEMMSPRGHALTEKCSLQNVADKAELDSAKAQDATDQKNRERAQALFREFRNDLGLPPIEKQ